MDTRYFVSKLTNNDYVGDFYLVIDYHHHNIIRWFHSYEDACELCDFLNMENADYV